MFTRKYFGHRYFSRKYWADYWYYHHTIFTIPPDDGQNGGDGIVPDPNSTSDDILLRRDEPLSFQDMEAGAICPICLFWCPGHALDYVDGQRVCRIHRLRPKT